MKLYTNKEFVHWHCHSWFGEKSFDSLISPEKLAMEARKMGFPAIALTDHGSLMGVIPFIKACRKTVDKKDKPIEFSPIKPIIGMEGYFCKKTDIGQYDEESKKRGDPKKYQPEGRRGNYHITLYCKNFEGYKNLCTLSQKSYMEGYYFDPRIDINLLSTYSKGLIGGTACLKGLVNSLLLYGKYKEAKKACGIYNEIFQGNFFLEAMYHGIREQREILPLIFKLSKELSIPVIISNDCHYLYKSQAEAQNILLTMQKSTCIKDPKRLRFSSSEFYLKSAQEMAEIFGEHPECFINSVRMEERVDFDDIEKIYLVV